MASVGAAALITGISSANSSRAANRAGRQAAAGAEEAGRISTAAGKKGAAILANEVDQVSNRYKPFTENASSDFQAYRSEVDNLANFQFDPSQIVNNPAYNFRLTQGLDALDRQYAVRGGIGGGGRLAGITDYAQGLASTEYENEYRRKYGEQLGILGARQSLAERGYGAVTDRSNTLLGISSGRANLISGAGQARAGFMADAANARAAGTIGSANAMQQGIGQLAYLGGTQGWFSGSGMTGGEQVDIPDYNEGGINYSPIPQSQRMRAY